MKKLIVAAMLIAAFVGCVVGWMKCDYDSYTDKIHNVILGSMGGVISVFLIIVVLGAIQFVLS